MPDSLSTFVEDLPIHTKALADSIFDFVKRNGIVTRYKINTYYSSHSNNDITEAINILLREGAIEYSPSGIIIGGKPHITIPIKSDSDIIEKIHSKLNYIELMDARMRGYLEITCMYNPCDEISDKIVLMPESYEKEILMSCFLKDETSFQFAFNDKRNHKIIKNFCDKFQCDPNDVELFTKYFLPSNFFIYILNRSVSYYRMMCLKYEQGKISTELMLNYVEGEYICPFHNSEEKVHPYDRVKLLVTGYIEYCRNNEYISFIECYLYLMNDYSIDVKSVDYLAYKMCGFKPDSEIHSGYQYASVFDAFVGSLRSIKYLPSEDIWSVLNELKSKYSEHAITPSKLFKDNQELLLIYYIEDESELNQVISKYSPYHMEDGYVCFDTTLSDAILKYAIDTNQYDWNKVSKSFIRKYGGNQDRITGYAGIIELKSEDAISKELNNAQLQNSIKNFLDYEWISADSAKDVFDYKCNCLDLFCSYNMHRLGFNIDGDAYYRTKYSNLRDCLKCTIFSGEDFFVDKRFLVSLECKSFKKEIDYLITNLMWVPVSDNRYVNLRSEKHDSLYRAMKRCRDLLKIKCQNEYMTAYKLKKSGTGIEYIDNDEFDIIFYDALLMSTRAKCNTILKQRAYHVDDEDTSGNSNFMKYLVKCEGGESNIISLKHIVESEYGMRVSETYIRQLISQSDCMYIRETDEVYENNEYYLKVKGKWKTE